MQGLGISRGVMAKNHFLSSFLHNLSTIEIVSSPDVTLYIYLFVSVCPFSLYSINKFLYLSLCVSLSLYFCLVSVSLLSICLCLSLFVYLSLSLSRVRGCFPSNNMQMPLVRIDIFTCGVAGYRNRSRARRNLHIYWALDPPPPARTWNFHL